jgi:hypothetical protein
MHEGTQLQTPKAIRRVADELVRIEIEERGLARPYRDFAAYGLAVTVGEWTAVAVAKREQSPTRTGRDLAVGADR